MMMNECFIDLSIDWYHNHGRAMPTRGMEFPPLLGQIIPCSRTSSLSSSSSTSPLSYSLSPSVEVPSLILLFFKFFFLFSPSLSSSLGPSSSPPLPLNPDEITSLPAGLATPIGLSLEEEALLDWLPVWEPVPGSLEESAFWMNLLWLLRILLAAAPAQARVQSLQETIAITQKIAKPIKILYGVSIFFFSTCLVKPTSSLSDRAFEAIESSCWFIYTGWWTSHIQQKYDYICCYFFISYTKITIFAVFHSFKAFACNSPQFLLFFQYSYLLKLISSKHLLYQY